MKVYETTHLVEQKDLNHHGTLFAAVMASWFVEMGFITASSEYKKTSGIVCVGINNMRFLRPVMPGTLLKMEGRLTAAGTTSLTVGVRAYDALKAARPGEGSDLSVLAEDELIVTGEITFVTVDETTRMKTPHDIRL